MRSLQRICPAECVCLFVKPTMPVFTKEVKEMKGFAWLLVGLSEGAAFMQIRAEIIL